MNGQSIKTMGKLCQYHVIFVLLTGISYCLFFLISFLCFFVVNVRYVQQYLLLFRTNRFSTIAVAGPLSPLAGKWVKNAAQRASSSSSFSFASSDYYDFLLNFIIVKGMRKSILLPYVCLSLSVGSVCVFFYLFFIFERWFQCTTDGHVQPSLLLRRLRLFP